MAQSQEAYKEEFKKELFDKLTAINNKLNRNETLTEEDNAILLMSSVLEEQG
ncbi:MAG: hypothetical protein VX341_09220 [Bdellovibrionota bacterium]|nr:hypothetical protein [Bdellovibrionota bacterium]|tara:strand:+ start:638 stop:793 length:156 start_codon:yes stop_codon:yes gene_type:complete